jgi:hypothetical protein
MAFGLSPVQVRASALEGSRQTVYLQTLDRERVRLGGRRPDRLKT